MRKHKINLLKSFLISSSIVGTVLPICFANYHNSVLNNDNHLVSNHSNEPSYHSMDQRFSSLFYPDIKKENVEPNRIHTNDSSLDRFNYVYYSPNTIVNCFHLYEQSSSEYKNVSINTNWKSESGFAYIAEHDYDPKANTFLDVFAGNKAVANYFSLGDYNKKCTLDALKVFLKVEPSIIDNKTLNFSRMFSNDLDRDNSVLALLNPTLWALILDYGEQHPDMKIKNIDLSYNNLRIVPNFASIVSDNSDSEWLFEKNGRKYMNHKYQGVTARDEVIDAYFDNIDLRHNELTYVELSAYIKRYLVQSSGYYPGLPTLINKIKVDEKTKAQLTNGLMLDYNHMPYLFFNQTSKFIPNEATWSAKALDTWKAVTIGNEALISMLIKGLLGTDIPPIIQSIELASHIKYSYLTYTVWGSEFDNSILTLLLMLIAPFGQYQTDAITVTPNEIANYFKSNNEIASLIENKLPSQLETANEINDKMCTTINNLHMMSVGINKKVSLIDLMSVLPSISATSSNDYDGIFYLSIKFGISIVKYLPSNIDIEVDKYTFNELLTAILSYGSLNKEYLISISDFKENKFLIPVYCCTFIPLSLGIIGLVSWRLYIYLKRKKKINLINKQNGEANGK